MTSKPTRSPKKTPARPSRKLLASPAAREYFLEHNRCEKDRSSRLIRRLQAIGLHVERSPHKTTLRIERPTAEVSFVEMKQAIRQGIDPKIGSAFLVSPSTGGVWIMQNRGNRPGVFIRQNQL